VKVGTVAEGTEMHRLARAATVGCGERSPLAESVPDNLWLRQGDLTSGFVGRHISLSVGLGWRCCWRHCGSLMSRSEEQDRSWSVWGWSRSAHVLATSFSYNDAQSRIFAPGAALDHPLIAMINHTAEVVWPCIEV
jgi:hypothetical protein